MAGFIVGDTGLLVKRMFPLLLKVTLLSPDIKSTLAILK
jgi:hypothetical protein